ncbi:antitoxin Xre/MbcA/ParS toxin-binding domain-containing protein [Caballeronia concitans]|uniref:antitoxin Xre/MbcA/ParS toxin-binding domain-containing protein n=1 Tax=Caballeronia concitans TaxID=1777133 RepID=UPI0035B56E60
MKSWRQGPSLARLLRLAQHVWSDSRDAAAWMSNAQIALGGKTPIQAVMTDSGAERVEAILWRRIHGATT